MTFADQLKATEFNAREIADRCAIPLSTAYAWLRGKHTPHPLMQQVILDKLRRHPAPTP